MNGRRAGREVSEVPHQRAAPLPVEVLEVVGHLRPEGGEPLRHRRLGVLLTCQCRGELLAPRRAERQHADDRLPQRGAGRVRFVDDRVQPRADREVQVHRKPDHREHRAPRVDPPVQEHLRLHQEEQQDDGGRGEKGHQVVGHREGEHEDDEDERVVVVPAPPLHTAVRFHVVAPEEDHPAEQRDGEQADGVDLLVDVALVPHRVRGGRHQHRRARSHPAHHLRRGERRQDPVHHQEPERRRPCAHQRREEVDPHRHGEPRRRQQQLPRPRHQHEERVTGRMRDPEDVRGGDVLARIPEPGRGRERDRVQRENQHTREQRQQVGRAMHCIQRRNRSAPDGALGGSRLAHRRRESGARKHSQTAVSYRVSRQAATLSRRHPDPTGAPGVAHSSAPGCALWMTGAWCPDRHPEIDRFSDQKRNSAPTRTKI